MKTKTVQTLTLLAIVTAMLSFAACSQEVSHTETDKPGMFGGHTRTESTTYQNPDGTTSTESSKVTTH